MTFMVAQRSRCLAVDLDGTLLHPEPAEIAMPGLSGIQYMSRRSADMLGKIAKRLPVIIATGRNARSVGRVLDHLNGISFQGFVMENGLLTRPQLIPRGGPSDSISPASPPTAPTRKDPWEPICRRLPQWRRLHDYEHCLGLVFPESETFPRAALETALAEAGVTGHIRCETRKLFVYPTPPSKRVGIRAFNVEPFIVLGDEWNDIDLLKASPHPGTLASAHPDVLRTVRSKKGYCSRWSSHAGTEDLLRWAADIARSAPEFQTIDVNPIKRRFIP